MAYLTIIVAQDGAGFSEGDGYVLRREGSSIIINHEAAAAYITPESARDLAKMLLAAVEVTNDD